MMRNKKYCRKDRGTVFPSLLKWTHLGSMAKP